MNRERIRAEDTSGLIKAGLTGWFWLGLGSTIALVIFGALRFPKRREANSGGKAERMTFRAMPDASSNSASFQKQL
jgi:hypothetical protein